ncbi:putative transcription factor C2H2 family [Arabidopsis thaliana]
MTSPPSPFAISPAAAVAADLPNDPDLTIVGFLKSPDSLPLYLLIGMIVYTVLFHYCNCSDIVRVLPHCGHQFHAFCIDKWFQLCSTCPSCRSIPVIYHPLLNVLIQK